MKPWGITILVAVVFSTTGCYHASIDTGLPPSIQTVHKTFAPAWINGLVPPNVLKVAAECPNGVARVETQISFLNQLVSFLTLGIFTPMEIKVTCAERSSAGMEGIVPDITLTEEATSQDVMDALALAAQDAIGQKRPVYVQLP